VKPFTFDRIPKIVFGPGRFNDLPGITAGFGQNVLAVTGGASHREAARWDKFVKEVENGGGRVFHAMVRREPSPRIVDDIVAEFRPQNIVVVVALGGGSVVDAGKAISAMLRVEGSVEDYLEGVGDAIHSGIKTPFIAVPTTAGAGSEATKNAVISRVGEGGYKKSLRHDNFAPDVALIDPKLHITCPPDVSAACGMDTFTQLLEGYVSTKASPMTNAPALGGLKCASRSLVAACTDGAKDIEVRGDMAYAALMSGIVLSNADLGTVHGLASSIGGFFDIPHGVVCATLVGAVSSATIAKLMSKHGPNHPALAKYAKVGAMMVASESTDVEEGCSLLEKVIKEWRRTLKIPMLGAWGVTEKDLDRIAEATSNKGNPIELSKDEIAQVVRTRL